MSHEGIFRISGNHKVVESLKATYDKGDATLNTHQLFLIINLFFKKNDATLNTLQLFLIINLFFNPLTPVPAVTGRAKKCSISLCRP